MRLVLFHEDQVADPPRAQGRGHEGEELVDHLAAVRAPGPRRLDPRVPHFLPRRGHVRRVEQQHVDAAGPQWGAAQGGGEVCVDRVDGDAVVRGQSAGDARGVRVDVDGEAVRRHAAALQELRDERDDAAAAAAHLEDQPRLVVPQEGLAVLVHGVAEQEGVLGGLVHAPVVRQRQDGEVRQRRGVRGGGGCWCWCRCWCWCWCWCWCCCWCWCRCGLVFHARGHGQHAPPQGVRLRSGSVRFCCCRRAFALLLTHCPLCFGTR